MTSSEDREKILLVAFEEIPSHSGKAAWLAEKVRELARHFELDVLSLKSEELAHIERFHGARLLRVPVGKGPFVDRVKAFQRALNRQIDSEEYRLCHFTSIWEGMVLASRKKAHAFKLIYDVHSLPSVDFKARYPNEASAVEQSYSLKQQEERCLSLADEVLVGSRLLQRHVIGRGVDAGKVSLVRPALDIATFDDTEGLARQSNTIVYLGSLAPWQGVSSLLMAVAELPHGLPVKLVLIVPGDDPGLPWLQGKVQMLGLARKVEVVEPAPLSQLSAIVARAGICVAPLANHEHNRLAASISHKLLVYMACRRPVVASSQPAVREILEDGVHGLLYHPGDARGLAAALNKLLHDRDLASQLGNQARLHLEDTLSMGHSLEQLMNIYRRTIGPLKADTPSTGEPDTAPQVVVAAGDTPVQSGPAVSSDHSRTARMEDTARILISSEPRDKPAKHKKEEDTEPGAKDTEEDLVFRSVADEDTAPRPVPPDSDSWQVMDLNQINLPELAEPTSQKEARFLLGGPPYPVSSDLERTEIDPEVREKLKRKRAEKAAAGAEFVSDSDVVELVEEDEIAQVKGRPPRPKPRAKKRKKS